MERNFQRSLSLVLKHEGGFVDHPADPGGATNKGVTIATFRAYVKPNGSVDDLKALTDEQAGTVYRREYWDRVAGAEMPDGLDYAMFDFAVNSGPARATKYLQAIVGVVVDGAIGPATLKAIAERDPAQLVEALCDARLKFLRKLNTWDTFGKGWSRRVEDVRDEAHLMLVQPVAAALPRATELAPPVLSGADPVSAPVPTARPDLVGRPTAVVERILQNEGSRTIAKANEVIKKTVVNRAATLIPGGGFASILLGLGNVPVWIWIVAGISVVALGVILFLSWRQSREAVAIKVARVDNAITGGLTYGGATPPTPGQTP